MVSNNIRRAREKKGISQAKLAIALGVKENTVWRWENNKSTPNENIIVDIANILDSTPAELLTVNDNEHINHPTIQKEQQQTDFTYWGGILNETRNAINRGNQQEISLIETFLNYACAMITDSKKQKDTTTQNDSEISNQHFDIHDNTMKAKNINVGTASAGVNA